MTTAQEIRHADHMERARAAQRRSSYDRVLGRVAHYEAWERLAPLGEYEREQLGRLREMRDKLRAEMVEHGQIEPEPEGAAA